MFAQWWDSTLAYAEALPSIVVPFHRLYHWLLGHFPPEEVGVPSN